jgi:hypothetical protein
MYLMFNYRPTRELLGLCLISGIWRYWMAGYSGTPLPQKLGIKPDHVVALVLAPHGFAATLGPLPDGVAIHDGLPKTGSLDVIVFFTKSVADLKARFPALARRLKPGGGLWIGWPKKSSGVATDVTEDKLREVILPTGMVDNKVCAIDETWSGLRFVVRLVDRPKKKAKDK